MTGRDDATTGSGAISTRHSAAILADLSELRARVADARRRSAAISATALELCAVSQATCDEAKRRRTQWQEWRRGIAALRVRDTSGAQRPTLHFCPCCETVCFSDPQTDATPPELWVEPPDYVKVALAGGRMSVAVSAAPCPRCAAAEAPAAPEPPPAETVRSEIAVALLSVLDEISTAAEDLAVLDTDDAFDHVLSQTIERLSDSLSVEELGELACALHVLMRKLLVANAASRPAPSRRPRAHLRPRLLQR